MTEMTSKRHVHRRATTAAWHTRARGAMILAVVVVAACDESVVAPPAALVAASPPSALRSPAPASDRDILIALHEATGGPSWRNGGNWLTDAPLEEWFGVRADADGRVVSLDLRLNGLKGPIPRELGGLAELETLSLGNNELTGPIPAELGNLAHLDRLNLERNQLSGPIPAELGGLGNLGTLWLFGNQLSGTIPPELGNLANVWQMSLASNELSGPIPAELGGLANLEWLYLGSNELTGTVPLSFLQLSQLQGFGFGGNAGLCLPADLVAWYEGIEEREGPVCPDAEVLRALYEAAGGGGWTNADGWLGDGPLGQWYGVDVDASGRVSTVDLEGNGLSGRLPGRLGDLAGLTTLRIGDNALSGRLPSSLARTPLQELRYANTDLCVPAEVSFREWLAAIPQHEGTEVQCPPLSDRGHPHRAL